jgi:hypothetical protein
MSKDNILSRLRFGNFGFFPTGVVQPLTQAQADDCFRQQFRGRKQQMRNSLLLTVAAAGLLSAASSALAGTWVPANVPSGGSAFTVFGINDKNVLTGAYTNGSGIVEGVVGPFDGSAYTSFDDGGSGTQPRGLNNGGTIMGFDTGTLQQWERSAGGTMKNVTKGGVPVALALAQGINKSGLFAGDYSNSSGVETGATGAKGKYTSNIKLKYSNSGYAGRAVDTAGDVAGWYFDSSTGLQRGFAIISGAAIRIDYPNAVYTVVEGLNDKGIASGQWEDSSSVIHGFVYNIAKKKFTSLDAPGASFTQVWGINNHNVVSASAALSSGTASFAYCISTTGCPSAHAGVVRTQQRPSGKAVPQAN